MEVHRVFVYGTLKRNEPNHFWFSKRKDGFCKFIGTARTTVQLPLIITTKYNIPFLLNSPGNGAFVIGEVFEVDNKVLEDLDELEDCPNFYVRKKIDVTYLNENISTETVLTYVIDNFNPKLLNETCYESYNNLGPHGKKYVARYGTDKFLDYKEILI